MRMHNRTMWKKYVRNADIGDTAVNEIWHGNTQIYPDNETLVKALKVAVPDEGTLEWAYWVHAVRGVTLGHELYRSSSQLKLEVGTEAWWCGSNRPTGLYLATITEDGELTFSTDQGPPVADVQKGDVLTFYAIIPATNDNTHRSAVQDATTKAEWNNPYLPNTHLYLHWYKGQKKHSAGVDYTLTGISSGTQMIAGSCRRNGHNREECYGKAYPWACRVGDTYNAKSGDDEYVEGDTGLAGWFKQFNSCSSLYTWPVYPAFTKTFKLTVKSVTIQSNS